MKEDWIEILPKLYQQASAQTLKEFIHRCADGISGRKPPNFESFSSMGWSQDEFNHAVQNTCLFLIEAITGNFDFQMIKSTFPVLDEQLVTAISNCLNVRSNELKESLLAVAASTPGTSLTDFDWKLKWVLGSSSLSTLEEPLLSLNLHTVSKSENLQSLMLVNKVKQQTVNLELGSAELDSLINSLEAVESSPQR